MSLAGWQYSWFSNSVTDHLHSPQFLCFQLRKAWKPVSKALLRLKVHSPTFLSGYIWFCFFLQIKSKQGGQVHFTQVKPVVTDWIPFLEISSKRMCFLIRHWCEAYTSIFHISVFLSGCSLDGRNTCCFPFVGDLEKNNFSLGGYLSFSATSLGTHGWLSLGELSVHIHSFCFAPNMLVLFHLSPSLSPLALFSFLKPFTTCFKSVLWSGFDSKHSSVRNTIDVIPICFPHPVENIL